MKKLLPVIAVLSLLIACGVKTPVSGDVPLPDRDAASAVSVAASPTQLPKASAVPAAQPTAVPGIALVETTSPTAAPASHPAAQPTAAPVPQPTEIPAQAPTAAPTATPDLTVKPAASVQAAGRVPFHLAEGTGQWWQIDASDDCYWALADQINRIRAQAGLGDLVVDTDLSAIAGSRCQSFADGGPFDHSGMATPSEICAMGGLLTTASEVCSQWQNSPNHYAAMTGDFTRMGIACWFASQDGARYTYWCVTFA